MDPEAIAGYERKAHTDYPGYNLDNKRVGDADDCTALCDADDECAGKFRLYKQEFISNCTSFPTCLTIATPHTFCADGGGGIRGGGGGPISSSQKQK